MSETYKEETGADTSAGVGMESPVKSLSSSVGKVSDGSSGQVVSPPTTTTQAPCEDVNKELTQNDDLTTNTTEQSNDNSTLDVEKTSECEGTRQQISTDNSNNAVDLATSVTPTLVADTNPESDVQLQIDNVPNYGTTRTTGDQDEGSLSEEQNDQCISSENDSTGTGEPVTGSSVSCDGSLKSMDDDGVPPPQITTQSDMSTKDEANKGEGDQDGDTPVKVTPVLEPASCTGGINSSLTADLLTSGNKESTNQDAPSSKTGSEEQLVVTLPAADSVREATAGESACAADEDCGATAAASPSALGASAAPGEHPQSTGAVNPDDPNSAPSVYSVKWVMFKNNKVPVITQNENGPCPLIAIMNVLLLQKKIQFPALMEMVTSDQLMSYLGECIFENAPKNITEDSRLNYEQNMEDAMAVFHKLQTGLDVNVRFTGVCDFEYTPECIIFDLLEIRLYHGWLVDPQEPQVGVAVANCSYNQLVEKIIAQKSSDKQELVTEALIAETFLESSASQLTYHGLCELSTTVKEGELCVCFRNNHFSTLYKHKGELFILVTDQGFLTESSVVWETLSNVEGDCHFVDANFHTYTKPELAPLVASEIPAGSDQQIDQDYLVALSLQQEQQLTVDQENGWNPQQQQQQPSPPPSLPGAQLSDHELAMRLQEEEDRKAAAAYQQQQQQQPPSQQPHQPRPPSSQSSSSSGGRRPRDRDRDRKEKDKDKDSCAIL